MDKCCICSIWLDFEKLDKKFIVPTATLRGRSRVLEKGGHILNQLSVHDITGDIKCIIAVHSNFNACYRTWKHAPQNFFAILTAHDVRINYFSKQR